jgi:proliferating cell nuclear antigen
MFKCEIKLDIVRELLDTASTLVKEGKFVFSKDGIEFSAADSARVAILKIIYSSGIWEGFSGEKQSVAVDIGSLEKLVALGKSGQKIQFETDEDGKVLTVKLSDVIRKMRLIIDKDITDPPIPSLPNLIVSAVIKIEDLRTGIKGSSSIGEEMSITIQDPPDDGFKGLIMHSNDDSDEIIISIPKDRLPKMKGTESPIRGLYPLKFFTEIVASIKTADQVSIQFGQDYPLKLDFALSAGLGKAMFILAPKILEN